MAKFPDTESGRRQMYLADLNSSARAARQSLQDHVKSMAPGGKYYHPDSWATHEKYYGSGHDMKKHGEGKPHGR